MAGNLGELEQLLLMGLLRRNGEASGIELRAELLERADRSVLPGAIYTIMERLRTRGLVTASTGESTSDRGGRRRKYYHLTDDGRVALAEAFRRIERMSEGLGDLLHEPLEGK